ncbi:MAG: hypothetical protein KTR22_03540 [Flavobacteriaceae bacterium]|nr:hypothetical protein [Flavobacteriaceae bacterium]
MKRLFTLFTLSLLLVACNNDDNGNGNDNNPNLTPPLVNLSLNLNLPQYNPLNFDGNTVVLPGQGIRGIAVYRQSSTQIFAYELSDPNHVPNGCSGMDLNGIIATCPCTDDENSYALALFGLHENNQDLFPMLQYRVQKNGNVILITN